MILPAKSKLSLALAALLATSPFVLAQQEPSFDGLPDNASETQLLKAVRELSRKVQELEGRLESIEVKNAPRAAIVPMAPSTRNEALEKLVADSRAARDKLQGLLDGHHFADPADPRVVYWKIKNNRDWPQVTATIKSFKSSMDAVLPRYEQLAEQSSKTYVELIKWGRGRVLYRTGLGMEQADVLAVDFAAAIVPVPEPPQPPGSGSRAESR